MVDGVQYPAPSSSTESKGVAKHPRKVPIEENKGAPKHDQSIEDRAESMVPAPREDNE